MSNLSFSDLSISHRRDRIAAVLAVGLHPSSIELYR